MTYLLDSYALIAHYGQNDFRFRRYLGGDSRVSIFSLLETYYRLLELGGREKADALYASTIRHFAILEVRAEDVPSIARLRHAARRAKRRLSYADAANLHLARRDGLRLVTSDQGLKREPGVEFVGP